MWEKWGRIADMVSPPGHLFRYGSVGHGSRDLKLLVVNSAQRNACPGTSNLRRRLRCQSSCQADITGPTWLRQALICTRCAANQAAPIGSSLGMALRNSSTTRLGKV